MSVTVRVCFPGRVEEQVDVSLMFLTPLEEDQGRRSLWLVWLQRPRKVGDVEDVESPR